MADFLIMLSFEPVDLDSQIFGTAGNRVLDQAATNLEIVQLSFKVVDLCL
jgi:hypothetical protein